ncbi:hypothetical protein BGX29_002576 [Mortierella sp. GBA35]|nr:hypothetical protein BGX29_002576 [Mortierella sp. GBA35]
MNLPSEILIQVAEYLVTDNYCHRDLGRAALVSRTFYEVFNPLLWSKISFSCKIPTQEALQANARWVRSLVYLTHYHPNQFSLGPEFRSLESLELRWASFPFRDNSNTNSSSSTRIDKKAYSDQARQLIRQNRSSLRHLALGRMKFPRHVKPGIPDWSPFQSLAFGTKVLGLRSLELNHCRIGGLHHQLAFWTLCEQLEVLHVLNSDLGEFVHCNTSKRYCRFLRRQVASLRSVANTITITTNTDNADNTASTAISTVDSTLDTSSRHTEQDEDIESRLRSRQYPRMTDLSFFNCQSTISAEFLDQMVAQCPRLQRFSLEGAGQDPSLSIKALRYLTHPALRTTTWPDLESFAANAEDMDNTSVVWTTDKRFLSVIEAWPRGKLRDIEARLCYPYDTTFRRLVELHSMTLRSVFLATHERSSGEYVQIVLENCPLLESIKSQSIHAQVLIEGLDRPWPCENRLQEWEVYIDMDPHSPRAPQSSSLEATTTSTSSSDYDSDKKATAAAALNKEWCHKVFSRLGRLRTLRSLTLQLCYQNILTHPAPKNSMLHLSLRYGLDQLAGLTRLKALYVQGDQTQVRRRDIQWMLDHWVGLRQFYGGHLSTRTEPSIANEWTMVWDFVFCRMLNARGVATRIYHEGYLNERQLDKLAAISNDREDEDEEEVVLSQP